MNCLLTANVNVKIWSIGNPDHFAKILKAGCMAWGWPPSKFGRLFSAVEATRDTDQQQQQNIISSSLPISWHKFRLKSCIFSICRLIPRYFYSPLIMIPSALLDQYLPADVSMMHSYMKIFTCNCIMYIKYMHVTIHTYIFCNIYTFLDVQICPA